MLKKTLIAILLVTSMLLSGCSKTIGTAAPAPTPDAAVYSPTVSATGEVVPVQWAALSARVSGIIDEVKVADGDMVESGQPLMVFSGLEAANAAVTAARLEVVDAQFAFDNLENDSAATAAKAQSDMVAASDTILRAEKALDEMERKSYLDKVKQAQADVEREKSQLGLATQDFEPYTGEPETNSTRKYYADRLADQQRDYDAAVRDLQELQMQKQAAEADLAAGKAMYDTARKMYEERKDGPSESDRLMVQARLENAQARLALAEEALAQLSLPAPFAGQVSNPAARSGEMVSAGQTLLFISDPSAMQVETTDLNEIDVARLKVGDSATVTFDALPGVTVNGSVSRISSKPSGMSGVNYTVVIGLDELPDGLLWGMTAFVEINVEE